MLCAAAAAAVLAAPAVVAPSAAVAGPALAVQLSRSTVRQGEAIRLSVQAAAPAAQVSVRFAGRTWPAYPAGRTAWRTILGTDPTTTPGRQTIAIEVVTAEGARRTVRRDVTVARVAYPTRRVTFDPETQVLLTPENATRERKRVQEALRLLATEQLWQDPLAVPIEGTVGSGYGVLSIYEGVVRGFHGGADFPAPAGTPVKAAGDGIARLAELLPLSGNAILIDHGLGVVSSYLHLSEIDVHAGQRVKKGDMIGRVGSTGLVTGPHLHWGLTVNGVRVDPMPWTKP